MDFNQSYRNITDLSNELLCNILKYLPLREALSIAMLCRKLSAAVDMHLRLCKSIDFCQDSVYGYMPGSITDDHMHALFKKCPHLETVYGLHPVKVERRRLRKRSALTVPGIIEALSLCYYLKAVETSDLRLFEAIMQHLPQIEIIGHFQNRDGVFPPNTSQKLRLQPYPRISSLHLIGVELPELTAMPHVQHLHLQCVRFTKLQPFRLFLAHNLKSFVMKHCMGPTMSLRYLSLIIALSSSPNLSHLELVRVPLPGGLFQRAVEDSHRHQGFVNLRTLVIGGCKGMLESDIGHLMIVSSKNLETLYIQPSLTKDSLFVSLSYAQCSFPHLRNLHLGYVDTLNSSGEWSEEALLSLGLAEVPDTPSSITDSGMKVISELFPHIKTMSVSNCPHLMVMYQWIPGEGLEAWSELTDLNLQKCHCLQLSSFALFISLLPCIQVVILRDMFREPPKGCSHVGLSAGTGLGMSSAVVSNQDEHIAVQGHHQDFDHPGEEDNEENEREFIDAEIDDNQEPHFMVLQRDFFDGEDDDDAGGEGQADHPEVPEDQDEGFNIYENQHGDNQHLYQEINNNDSDISDNNYDLSKPSSSCTQNNKATCTRSKYHLRQTPKRLSRSTKSVGVQADVDFEAESCELCGNPNPLIAEEVLLESEDSCQSQNVKSSALCGKMDSSQAKYDPYRPSTSKAGSHLDYIYSSDSKSCNMSDSEGDSDSKFSNNPKRMKKEHSSRGEVFQDEYFEIIDEDSIAIAANLSVKSEQITFQDDECKCHSSDMSEDSDVELSYANYRISPSLYNDRKLLKPCYVVVHKLDNDFLSDGDETSNTGRSVSEVNASAEESNSLTSETFSSSSHIHGDNSSDASEMNVSHTDTIPKNYSNESSKMLLCQDCTSNDLEYLNKNKQGNSFLNNDSHSGNESSSFVSKLGNKGIFNQDEKSANCDEKQNLPRDTSLMSDNDVKPSSSSFLNHDQGSVFKSKSKDGAVVDNDCNSVKNNVETLKSSILSHADVHASDKEISSVSAQCSSDLNTMKSDSIIKGGVICDTQISQASYSGVSNDVAVTDEKDPNLKLENEAVADDDMFEDSEQASKDLKRTTSIKNLPKSSQNSDIKSASIITEQHSSNINNSVSCNLEGGETLSVSSVDSSDEEDETEQPGTSSYTRKKPKTLKKMKKHSRNQFSKTTKRSLDTEKQKHTYMKQHCAQNTDSYSLLDNKNEMSKLTSCRVLVNKIKAETVPNKEQSKSFTSYDPDQPSTSKAWNNDEHSSFLSEESCNIVKDESKSICDQNDHSNHSSNASQYSNEIDYSNDISMSDDSPTLYVVIDGTKTEDHSSSSSDSEYEKRKRNSDKCEPTSLKPDEEYDLSLPSTSKSESLSYISDSEDESPKLPRTKKSKKSLENHYLDECEFYIEVPSNTSGSFEIVNSYTGVSYKTASCSVILSKIKNTSNCIKGTMSKDKGINKCGSYKNLCNKQSNVYDYDPDIPTSSKAGLSVQDESGSPAIKDNKGDISAKPKRGCKRSRKSENTVSNGDKIENKNISSFSDEYPTSSQNCIAKEESKHSSPIPALVNISENKIERLKISNSDAAVLLDGKKSVSLKNENGAFYASENSHAACGSYKPSNTLRDESALKSHPDFQKQMRRKRSRRFKYYLRNLPEAKKEYPSVPTITLVSEGTQATSADIRRAVRRIQRVPSQVRRAASSSRSRKISSHTSKISSKMKTTKPVSTVPPPESFDKATSTSDPLLEDDAVQTLQLSSSTLLSFTIVSCGISDLIIDRCPKLFHVEVQACRILKKFQMNYCPSMKRVNVSQCPKLSICALVSSVLSLTTDSYFMVSYEPCMQGYHPGDGEKAILSKIALNQSILLCHDFYDVSDEAVQASFKEKMLEWCRYLFRLHATLNYTREKVKRTKVKAEEPRSSEYPWSHDLRRIHGQYVGPSLSEFCCTEGRYDLLTNNPVFGEIFETHKSDTGFPAVNDCEAVVNNSVLSYEGVEKYFKMQKKFIGFYIPVTENNRTNIYD